MTSIDPSSLSVTSSAPASSATSSSLSASVPGAKTSWPQCLNRNATEPTKPLPESYLPLAKLLELLISRVGRDALPSDLALGDASWVSYRLAELLPLPLNIKQSMLEINDCQIRLEALAQFLKQQGLI